MLYLMFLFSLLSILFSQESNAQVLFPSGSTVTVNCNQNTTNCAGQYIRGTFFDLYNTNTTRSDSSAPVSPPTVAYAKLTYVGPCNNGGGSPIPCAVGGIHTEWYDNTQANKELYIRVRFKLNATYGCSLVGQSKIFFMRQFDNSSTIEDRSNGVFLVRGCDTNNRSMIFSHNSGTVNNDHTCATDLGLTCFENVGHVPIVNNQWVDFEACIRASTNRTSRDGILVWATNGVIVGRYTNFNYQGVNEFVWNQTWDGYGNGQGFNADAEQIVDHLVIAVPPSGGCASVVGGGGSSPPSPTPPPPPIGPVDDPAGNPSAPVGLIVTDMIELPKLEDLEEFK